MNKATSIALLTFCILSIFVVPMASLSEAYAQATQLRPVMIVRYNQPAVNYQNQLKVVVSRAMQIKPEVMFDVIHYTPAGAARSLQAQYELNNSAFLSSLVQFGVPPQQVNVMRSESPDVTSDEIYVFVR